MNKIINEELWKILKNSIISEIKNGKVFCLETKSDGLVEKYEVSAKIIISAIAAGGGAAVASLPDYLYVTNNVYRTHSTGKIYTRYENDYYLDSERTQYIGSWSFSERGFR